MKKKVFRIIISYVCLVIMISSIFGVAPFGGAASKAPKLVKKKAVLYVGKKTTIRLKNGKKTAKVKWKTTNKKVASIIGKKTRGNNAYCKIKAKKPGKCNIVAKYTLGTKSKKLRCQVVVKRKGGNELISPTIYPGVNPIETTIPTMSVTNKPGDSQNPETTPNGNSGATDNTETTPDGSSGSTDNPEATPDGSSGSTDNPEATPDGSSGSTDNPEATPDGSSGSTDNPETTPTQKPVVTNAPTQKPVVTNAPTQKPVVTNAPTQKPVVTNAPTQKPVVTNAPTQKPAVTNAPTQKPAVTNAPTQKPAVTNAPTAKPAGTSAPTYVSRELDLSGASTVYNAGKVTVNSDKTITAITEGNNKLQGVLIPLGDTLYAGETAKVTVYGTSTGSVRLWLSDGEAKRWSDIQDPMSFETTYSFTANNFEGSAQAGSNTIQIKATYGSTVDSIHITKVVIAVEADAPVSTPTGKPVATNAPTVKPSGTSAPTYVSRELDLSGASTVYNAGKVTVNSDKTITAITEGNNKLQGVLIPLGDTLYAGETAKVTVYGTSTGSVRLWLSDGQAKRWSDIQDPMSFETKYSFTANNFESSAQAGSNAIQIKATYGSTLDSIHITKVVIETMAKAPTPSPAPPKPTCTPIPGEENYKWVTTWGTAEEKNDITPEAMAPMTLNGSTIRQIIRVTTSGNTMKFRLSNQYGGSDVTIKSMHVAKQVKADESTIDTSTDTVVTVNGSEEFVIPRGKVIETDPVNISVNALDNIAISTYYGSCPSTSVTGHRGARATTYQMTGNNVSTETFTNYKTTTSWFFLADAAIWSPQNARAVVCFGDSITDGYGTDAGYLGKKPDSYTRWGDYFARRLQANDATKNVSVINEGIGSNSILGSYPTDAGKDRFARDLLEHDGVEYCIILFGVNDLDKLPDTSKFDRLKPEYEKMIALCKANNIKVYAAPILPFKGSSYFSEGSEATRQLINNWFKSSESGVDGIIDFASALVDPSNPLYILEKYTHSDGLHPYDGYEAMANAIDLTMFEK